MKIANHTALKEWSDVIAALGSGKQIVLIRKGGIADPSFGVEADRFYLYPTYFHQGESEPRASVTITCWAEVARTWMVRDVEVLRRLEPHVILPQETLAARYNFRPDQALYVIALRVFRLLSPAVVRWSEAYGGCRSWISLDEEIEIDGSTQVLGDRELASRIAEISGLVGANAA